MAADSRFARRLHNLSARNVMAIVAGIDEAGYGPTLGPLVASAVVFRTPDEVASSNLWEVLRKTCKATPGKSPRRLAIADSKKLKRPDGDVQLLEQAALVMLAVLGKRPADWRAYVDTVAPGSRTEFEEYPWYACDAFHLPVSRHLADVGTRANAVRLNMAETGIELLGVHSAPLAEGHFNRLVARTKNKASVLCGLALRLMQTAMRAAQNEPVYIHVDRLGGRSHYRDVLMTSWPEFELTVLEETEECSAYRLRRGEQVCEIDFRVEGESRHLPVALASIYSKYLRELCMYAFNRYWSAQLTGLTPTAGYYTDAQRWLRDAEPALAKLQIDRRMLVRER